jgi:ABC-2 type transport system permease protein
MSPRITAATALRVLQQLRSDPRTIALIVVVPSALVALLKGVLEGSPGSFESLGGPMVGLFPLILMFLITSITMLRERTTGTLERLMTLPLAKLDLLAGYGIAFALVAAVQAIVTSIVAFALLGVDAAGSTLAVVALAIANALLGMAMGLLASAFARTEFQVVQFMPAFVLPQLLLCGLFAPREAMAPVLEALSYALPMSYAFDALQRITVDGSLGSAGTVDVVVTVGATVLALVLAAMTLRRRTQ